MKMKPKSTLNFLTRAGLITCCLLLVLNFSFSQTVYITNTGCKYHASACQYLSKSKIATQLDTALTRGYTVCSVCKPTIRSTTAQGIIQRKELTPASASAQCSAVTKAGSRCTRTPMAENDRCWQHQ